RVAASGRARRRGPRHPLHARRPTVLPRGARHPLLTAPPSSKGSRRLTHDAAGGHVPNARATSAPPPVDRTTSPRRLLSGVGLQAASGLAPRSRPGFAEAGVMPRVTGPQKLDVTQRIGWLGAQLWRRRPGPLETAPR